MVSVKPNQRKKEQRLRRKKRSSVQIWEKES